MDKRVIKRRVKQFILITTFLFGGLSAYSQSSSFVLDISGMNLQFLNVNRTLITNGGNNGLAAGSVWRYDNLLTTNGITIYGKMTILSTTNATITNFDDESTGLPGRFQPRITTTGGNGVDGYILYQIEFFEVITNNKVYISDYYFTAVDIDGGSTSNNNGEFVEVGGYSSYQVDATSQLTVEQTSERTRFRAIPKDLDGVTFDNTASFIARYVFPYTKVTFALGFRGNGASRENVYSIWYSRRHIQQPHYDQESTKVALYY
ncbi:MAG: hypothetical protein QM751_15600 [Paludibacteraceae bacterium]